MTTQLALPGRKCKAYYNTGTYASPTWVEFKHARDVETPFDKNKFEVLDRSSEWAKSGQGHKTGRCSLGYRKRRATDAAFDALLDSFVGDTVLDVLILDGEVDEAGALGWRMPVVVHEANQKQPLGDQVEWSFGLEIVDAESAANVEFAPTLFEVA